MSKHAEKLKLRRQALVTKSQAERMLLVLRGQQLSQSLGLADMGMQIAGKLAQRPIIGLGILLATIIIKPRRIIPLLKKALSVWQIWQLVAPSINKIKKAAAPAQ
ncbi:MAG: YqjK family protein [Pseudomonadota bacterium]